VEPEELDEIAPGRSRTIDINGFVDLDEIDPIFYQKTYWLAPAKKDFEKPYALLAKAMADTNRAGIATFVMRGKQYLTAIRARDGVLALETLYFADEIRDAVDPVDVPVGAKELKMATSLIESMTEPWQPEEYRDTYTERVQKLKHGKMLELLDDLFRTHAGNRNLDVHAERKHGEHHENKKDFRAKLIVCPRHADGLRKGHLESLIAKRAAPAA